MSDGGLTLRLNRAAFRGHVLVSVVFVAARLALDLGGLRMYFSLGWMWSADPADLGDRFWHTIFYFHAMPPGMNSITAFCVKVGGAHPEAVAHVLFEGFGLLLANALFALARAMGLSVLVAAALALGFGLSPPALYFDHLYLYETPVTALLALVALGFVRAVRAPSFRRWLACFGCAAVVCFTRSTFHLVWLLLLVALGTSLVPRARRTELLRAALAPCLLLVALYAKNLAVFGFFGAFSEGGSLNLLTTRMLPPAETEAWIAEGKLSRYAAVDVFAGPRAYLPFFPSAENPRYPPELSRLTKPTTGAADYNHWFFLDVMPVRRHDALVVMRERPLFYLQNAAVGLVEFFSATTHWSPGERYQRPTPHDEHRALLGRYENAYNAVLHGFPLAPVGLYVVVPLLLAGAVVRAWKLRGAADPDARALAAFLWFALFQIAYVVATSTLFSALEEPRYRYQIEPLLWLLAALAVARLVAWRRA